MYFGYHGHGWFRDLLYICKFTKMFFYLHGFMPLHTYFSSAFLMSSLNLRSYVTPPHLVFIFLSWSSYIISELCPFTNDILSRQCRMHWAAQNWFLMTFLEWQNGYLELIPISFNLKFPLILMLLRKNGFSSSHVNCFFIKLLWYWALVDLAENLGKLYQIGC